MFSINFVTFSNDINSVRDMFTTNGFSSYTSTIRTSGFQDSIVDNKLDLNSIVSGDPVILFQGIRASRYIWIVNLPMMMSLESGSTRTSKNLNVRLTIMRVPVLDAPLGGIQINDVQAANQR